MDGPFANLILRSGRIMFRSWRISDARWYVESRDEEVFKWTTESRALTIEETEKAIAKVNSSDDAVCLAIVDAESDELLGNLALEIDKAHQGGEIHYWLAGYGRGRGVATESVKLLSHWAFATLGLKRIFLKAMAGNLASQRVAERAGYQRIASPKGDDGDWAWYELEATETTPV